MRKSEPRSNALISLLKDRGRLARTGVMFVWLLGLMVVTEAWRAPFNYRTGDFVARGIDSRIGFARVDEIETLRRQQEAAALVPFIFRNDPASISRLPDRLVADLGEIASAKDRKDVSEAAQRAFAFGPDTSVEDAEARFAELRAAVQEEGQLTTADRLKDVFSEFTNFVAPLMTHGVISPDDIIRLELERESQIRVLPIGETSLGGLVEPVALTRVQLSSLLNDGQELGGSWLSYPRLAPIRPHLERWLTNQIEPTLTYDEQITKQARGAARDGVDEIEETFAVGEPLVVRESVLTADDLDLLEIEHAAFEAATSSITQLVRAVLAASLILVLIILNAYYIGRVEERAIYQVGRLSVYAAAVVATVALSRAFSYDPWRAEIVPVLVFSIIFCVAYSQVFATVSAFTLCLLVTLSTTGDVRQFVVLISTTAAAILLIGRIQNRTTLVRVGFLTGLVYIGVFFAIRAVGEPIPLEIMTSSDLIREALLGGTWCLFCGFLVTGLLPFVESRFGVVTDMSLLELANASHPLLQDLVQRAPGTYNHSLAVGSISESAAEAIGANGLLCRVAALYHDVGKMLKPEYFIENQGAGVSNPHDSLAPAMSKLVIIGHVRDGVDLAEQYNLPRPMIDFIEQHHGTTLVEYFFREASKQAEGRPDKRTDAEEESFRYPGPKPQTREAGVMMLVDACESASRAMTDPTPKRLEQLVRDLSMKRLLDGQFDECNLTLSQLHKVEVSIVKSLTAIYHGRVKYPDAKTA